MAKKARAFSRRTLEAATLLGLQIRQRRIERDWTLTELASRAGISHPTLVRVERGDPTVGLGVALEVATIIGVPLFYEDPGRLGGEISRRTEILRLLPSRVSDGSDDVDDDF